MENICNGILYETPNNQSNKTSPEPLDTVMIKLNEI